MSHQSGELSDVFAPRSQFYHGSYGRMFRNLPPHVPTLDLLKGRSKSIKDLADNIAECLEDFLEESDQEAKNEKLNTLLEALNNLLKDEGIGKTERIILTEIEKALKNTDAGREAILKLLARTMIEKPHDQSEDGGNNDCIPAGYTYFSQFITHDITFDPTSSLMRFNDPDKLRNFRTPRLDLDSLYGGGPDDTPFFYEYDPEKPNRKYYLLVGKGENNKDDDLPRNSQGRALIGDPRNDENVIISQIQLAFIKFHNVIMDDLAGQGLNSKSDFHEAQRLVCWHYQWVILHDFLPKLVDPEILEGIWCSPDCPNQPKLCYYEWHNQPFVPVEFAAAVFRFGHSMIRARYNLNKGVRKLILNPNMARPSPSDDLRGLSYLPKNWTVRWDFFLNINNHSNLQQSRRIDTRLSSILARLPSSLGGGDDRSLATQDLLRGYKMELPSGQAVARAMGEDPLKGPEEPLWFYILREAEELREGRKLGPVGGRIVAEVIIGLLAGDPHSFLNVNPGWQPTYCSLGCNFELRDILLHAKVASVSI